MGLISKNKMKPLVIGICIVFIYFIWPYFLTNVFKIIKIEDTLSLTIRMILNFALLGLIIIILKNELVVEYDNFKKNSKSCMLKGLKIFIIGFILYSIANMILYCVVPSVENANYTAMSKIFTPVPVLLFISTIFYYPIIEELVFKKVFKSLITNKWFFVILTGFLNAFFQIALTSYTDNLTLLYIIPSAIFYMSFSYMYYETNTIYPAVIYKMIYNLIPNLLNVIVPLIIIYY